jgi:hypothetical protein
MRPRSLTGMAAEQLPAPSWQELALGQIVERHEHMGLGPPAPPPEPGSWLSVCGAERVVLAGGEMAQKILHPSFVPFEQLDRWLPESGMFALGVSPERPFQFPAGSFTVPDNMTLLLADYRFDIYVPSGAAAGDAHPIPERSLASIMGYDINIDQYRTSNIRYQIEPVPIQSEDATFNASGLPQPLAAPAGFAVFQQVSPPPAAFALADAARAAQLGPGLSLLPQRPDRQGPLPWPFTLQVKPGQTVQAKVFLFRPIPFPIAFIEADVTGCLVPTTLVELMLRSMAPCQSQGGGR